MATTTTYPEIPVRLGVAPPVPQDLYRYQYQQQNYNQYFEDFAWLSSPFATSIPTIVPERETSRSNFSTEINQYPDPESSPASSNRSRSSTDSFDENLINWKQEQNFVDFQNTFNKLGQDDGIYMDLVDEVSIVKMEPEAGSGDLDVPIVDENSKGAEDGSPASQRKTYQAGKNDACLTAGSPDPKLCGVCGDKALGNNFNAITCESCKAFFRRNALRTKEFVCPFNDSCKVDPVTRRFCQKCRLKKCFDIGMKKEWIMTDEEKKMKKQKIEQNRLKRASSSDVREADPTHPKERALDSANYILPESYGDRDASNSNSSNESLNFASRQHPQPMMPHNCNSFPGNSGAGSASSTCLKIGPPPSPVVGGNIDHIVAAASLLQHHSPIDPHDFKGHHRYNQPQSHNHLGWNGTPDSESYNEDEQLLPPTQHPILASLVRPGVAESPPEIAVSQHLPPRSQIYIPSTSHDSDYPTKKKTLIQQYHMEMHLGCCDGDSTSSSASSSLSSPPQLTKPSLSNVDHDEDVYVRDIAFGERKHLIDGELPPLPLNTMESILSVAISAEFNAFGLLSDDPEEEDETSTGNGGGSGTTASHHSQFSRAFNKAEKAKLSELFFASEALNAPVDLDGPIKIGTSDPSLINVINLTDIAIRRLIKMSKKIGAFKNMCQEDQIALLKGGCTEMMILRSVVSYDPERDSWNIPHSNGFNVKLGVLKEARGNLYEEHQRFVKSFKGDWRADYNIMIILCAITLFTPERPNVIHKDVVKLEQDSYYYLLKRYLESTRNGCEARSTYLQLIQRIAELHILNSNHLRVFLEVNPREVEPLLIEIFDLKQ